MRVFTFNKFKSWFRNEIVEKELKILDIKENTDMWITRIKGKI